ncbi:MAG: twin-arginine translocase TatA/TatE family subunit [Calditrichaeota bacterium]|nr:twin-arginine translocase TatA/TatE family subunit [Calditrichota bacterium]
MFGIGTSELLIILFIILLIFGSKKLPELAQGLGRGIREFKKATNEIQDELDLNKPLDTPSAESKKDKVSDEEHPSEKDENSETTKEKE